MIFVSFKNYFSLSSIKRGSIEKSWCDIMKWSWEERNTEPVSHIIPNVARLKVFSFGYIIHCTEILMNRCKANQSINQSVNKSINQSIDNTATPLLIVLTCICRFLDWSGKFWMWVILSVHTCIDIRDVLDSKCKNLILTFMKIVSIK